MCVHSAPMGINPHQSSSNPVLTWMTCLPFNGKQKAIKKQMLTKSVILFILPLMRGSPHNILFWCKSVARNAMKF